MGQSLEGNGTLGLIELTHPHLPVEGLTRTAALEFSKQDVQRFVFARDDWSRASELLQFPLRQLLGTISA